ncbi:hypothetical protein NLU13_5192 [Sarocladium strictum]|uniref:Zn(2)-C6 fungal-type domain-containing protein n=1 Tax=Sarocladium strictum TaxID=5046 RepID=A0AA39GH59_SARSR|nr:hypothetical protein NLU13_5192 [Sarocladium strictum]
MQHQRRRGACLQCVKKKRRCDHKWPQCTQCAKHKQMCQLQNFRVSTTSSGHSRGGRGQASSSSSKRSTLQFVSESGSAQVVPDTPVTSVLPSTPESDDGPIAASLDVGADISAATDFDDAAVLDFSDRSPHAGLPYGDMGFPGEGTLSMAALATASQLVFSDATAGLLPLDDASVALGTSMSHDQINAGGELVSLSSTGDRAPYLDVTLGHYCPVPWPSDMLASPDRRFLWQYFLRIAESDFLCLDWDEVSHLYGFQHPYITTLPQMALANEALRPAIFCFAAAQYELRHGDGRFGRTKAVAGSEAARALSRQAARDTDDANILAMISAATLLQYFGTERGEYLRLASRLVSTYLARAKAGRSSPPAFPEVPLTEFRWGVISTLCSLHHPTTSLDADICRMIEMSQREIEQNYSQAFEHWVSHPIYTFSPRLVNPLLKIGLLLQTQLRQAEHAEHVEASADPNWASRVSQAEDMLLEARDRDMKVSTSMLGSADPAGVVALNESMYAAAAILIYARCHGLPATAPFIRRQTQIVFDEVAKIPPSSHVSFSIIFPLFIAGCEAIEQHMRDVIIERLRDPGGVTYDRGDLGGTLKHIWGIRDMEPGLPWPQWVKKMDAQYRTSCLM